MTFTTIHLLADYTPIQPQRQAPALLSVIKSVHPLPSKPALAQVPPSSKPIPASSSLAVTSIAGSRGTKRHWSPDLISSDRQWSPIDYDYGFHREQSPDGHRNYRQRKRSGSIETRSNTGAGGASSGQFLWPKVPYADSQVLYPNTGGSEGKCGIKQIVFRNDGEYFALICMFFPCHCIVVTVAKGLAFSAILRHR
jgi:hypothetical protein